jgi:hypothetical protein
MDRLHLLPGQACGCYGLQRSNAAAVARCKCVGYYSTVEESNMNILHLLL